MEILNATNAGLTQPEPLPPVASRHDAIDPARFRWLRPRFPGLQWVVILLSALVSICGEAQAQARPAFNETQLKAVFLFNFAQFVVWPPHAFTNANAPIVVAVLGEDPFGALLDDLVRGEVVGNRRLQVVRFRRAEEIQTCHVLFIAASEASRLDQIFRVLDGKPILTVGDTEAFERRGGMIRILTENKKMRLRVNLDAVREARIEISSNLLRPAQIISGKSRRSAIKKEDARAYEAR